MLAHFSGWWRNGLWLRVTMGRVWLRFGGGLDWRWLRFCDGGRRGRWMGFVNWKRKARGGG